MSNLWRGEVDTAAPRITLEAAPANAFSTYYRCSATDYHLSDQGFQCPTVQCVEPQYLNAPWYTAVFSEARLYQYVPTCTAPRFDYQGPQTLTACDIYNQCSSTTYTPGAGFTAPAGLSNPAESPRISQSAGSNNIAYQLGHSNSFVALTAPSAAINTVIFTPTAHSVYTTLAPISIQGYASSPDFLRALTVTVNGVPISTTTWANGAITETLWTATWTPGTEKTYRLDALTNDWAGNVTTGTQFAPDVYVDTTAPQISIATNSVNSTNFNASGYVTVRGLITETVGVKQL